MVALITEEHKENFSKYEMKHEYLYISKSVFLIQTCIEVPMQMLHTGTMSQEGDSLMTPNDLGLNKFLEIILPISVKHFTNG